MQLPPVEASDDEVRAWVRTSMIALDDTKRKSTWRFNALGMSLGEALADAPRDVRVTIVVPVGEARLISDAAKARGIPRDAFIRRVLGTWMVAMEDCDPDAVPALLVGGLIQP